MAPRTAHLRGGIPDRDVDAFNATVTKLFDKWQKTNTPVLMGITLNRPPKALIETLSENLLTAFLKAPLVDA